MNVSKTAAFLLVGLGALAVYKWNKLSQEDKDALREKGKKIFDEHINPLLKSALGMPEEAAEAAKEAMS